MTKWLWSDLNGHSLSPLQALWDPLGQMDPEDNNNTQSLTDSSGR